MQEVLSQVTEDNPTIILSDISAEDIKSIVEFIYRGEVRIPVDNIKSLLEAAQSLKISGLVDVSMKLLLFSINYSLQAILNLVTRLVIYVLSRIYKNVNNYVA